MALLYAIAASPVRRLCTNERGAGRATVSARNAGAALTACACRVSRHRTN